MRLLEARFPAAIAKLRRLPALLKYVPGPAQDVRAYFLTLQYWLGGTAENLANLVRMLVSRYAAGPRAGVGGALRVAPPMRYPEVGLYHPRAPGRIVERLDKLPGGGEAGTVGVLVMRSYVLAGNAAHYDGVLAALEARGLRAVPAETREAAVGLGYAPARLLLRVELPLALPVVLAGLRVAAVSTVALTTRLRPPVLAS